MLVWEEPAYVDLIVTAKVIIVSASRGGKSARRRHPECALPHRALSYVPHVVKVGAGLWRLHCFLNAPLSVHRPQAEMHSFLLDPWSVRRPMEERADAARRQLPAGGFRDLPSPPHHQYPTT